MTLSWSGRQPSLELPVTSDASPDITLGAYFLFHLTYRCENCGTTGTPQWRKGWFDPCLGRSVCLCNACGLKFHKNQSCPYCHYIYYKEEDKTSTNIWCACDACHRWVHIKCENQSGYNCVAANAGFYSCPACRNGDSYAA